MSGRERTSGIEKRTLTVSSLRNLRMETHLLSKEMMFSMDTYLKP